MLDLYKDRKRLFEVNKLLSKPVFVRYPPKLLDAEVRGLPNNAVFVI